MVSTTQDRKVEIRERRIAFPERQGVLDTPSNSLSERLWRDCRFEWRWGDKKTALFERYHKSLAAIQSKRDQLNATLDMIGRAGGFESIEQISGSRTERLEMFRVASKRVWEIAPALLADIDRECLDVAIGFEDALQANVKGWRVGLIEWSEEIPKVCNYYYTLGSIEKIVEVRAREKQVTQTFCATAHCHVVVKAEARSLKSLPRELPPRVKDVAATFPSWLIPELRWVDGMQIDEMTVKARPSDRNME